jgi:Flp pilus assembly pilin Flp
MSNVPFCFLVSSFRFHWRNPQRMADKIGTGDFMRKYLRLIKRPASRRHRAMVRLVARSLKDDRGGEVLEYALVAGLIVVGAMGVISCVGDKVVARWNSLGSSI